MEIRFGYILKISHNDRSNPLSPLTWFKLQCWDLVFTWINQFKLIPFHGTFGKPFWKKEEFSLIMKYEERKAVHSSRKWVHLQEDSKEPLSKNKFFTFLFLDTTIPQGIPFYFYGKAWKSK